MRFNIKNIFSRTKVSEDKKAKASENKIAKPKKESYKFNKYVSRLEAARAKYELNQLSNLSDHGPIDPLTKIQAPRYKYNKESKIYESSKVEYDGVADILLVGDIMCRAEQQDAALNKYNRYDFQDMFPLLKNTLSKFDFLAGNLETTISESACYTHEMNRNDNRLNRNSPNTVLDTIRDAGFDFIVTANNHCMDAGLTGIYQTICHLKQYGLFYTGTFLDKKDRNNHPYIMVEIDGIKVAFLGYTYGTNGRVKQLKKSGRNLFVNKYEKSLMESDVAKAKSAGAEFVIVYTHWGVEFTHNISEDQIAQAKDMANAGVDFVAGSHPHVIQPFGTVTADNGKVVPVIYSMGNFISSMPKEPRRDSIAINLKLFRDGEEIKIKEISYLPCYTCIKYQDYDYTTLPLTDELCESNEELQASKKRIEAVMAMGTALPEYKSE